MHNSEGHHPCKQLIENNTLQNILSLCLVQESIVQTIHELLIQIL